MSTQHSPRARSLCVFSVTVVLGLGGGGVVEAQQPPSPQEPPELEWQRTFGGSEYDTGRSVEQTSDGGYVLCGWTESFGAGGNDVYVVKLRGDGPPSGRFRRGDCNADGQVEGQVTDAVCTLSWLVLGEADPGCLAATNADGVGAVNITDPIYLLTHLFLGGPALVEPFPDCGTSDLEADANLGCEETACP